MVHYPLVRSLKPALLWPMAYALLLYATSHVPVLFILLCFLSPVLLSLWGFAGGMISIAACAIMAPAAAWLLFGGTLVPLLLGLYLLPYAVVHAVCFTRKVPFWHAAGVQVAILAVSQTAILVLLRPYLGGNLFSGGAEFLVQQIASSPYGDQILMQLYQTRLLDIPEELLTGARALMEVIISSIMPGALTPSIRTELLNGLRTLLENALYSFLPATLINNAILAGVFGMAFPIAWARKKKIPVPEMAPFATWHLGRSTGLKVMLLGLGNILPALFPNPGMLLAGNMMWAAFSTIFIIQGAALMEFFQTRSGSRPLLRRLWPCVIYLLVPTLLMVLGIADQFMNIRGLRKPKDREEG